MAFLTLHNEMKETSLFRCIFFQGGSVSVHSEEMKLQNLSDQGENDGAPTIPPPEMADTIDGECRHSYACMFCFFAVGRPLILCEPIFPSLGSVEGSFSFSILLQLFFFFVLLNA